ncbi:hypothetical protein ABZ816_03645 [Actinosynnema sp. NPDC047251]|uniref:Uncharacterized protein n=1 Tax=Saccharothrix espanaensis (strain ATCC 51144 / DSM 44229 / JCM 9112 / NBRC 15066 / NRRL 15764) TaxID=1179773 RepID=K0K1A4_SACES|nr:hypothetical protein [Saccharothrix espanaensis]CCH31352.1 hypothetical protein BN6_40660 [Saccharothrix espanaensis DSM 44229]
MRVLYEGQVWVHYGQFSVESTDGFPEMGECFGGQRNGLCGAASPGNLFLITGTHTGEVGFVVESHDGPPPLDEGWEEVVEVPFRPVGEMHLVGWAAEWSAPLDLPVTDYRVRYSAIGMDREQNGLEEDPERERYLLQFWPAPPAPDEVVRLTGEQAAYWHRFASEQPPPPTPEQKAEALRAAEAERRRAAEEALLETEKRDWGGTLPADDLRALRGRSAKGLAAYDRPLVDALAAAPEPDQRAIARWAVRRAYAEAGIAGLPWIASALDVLDRGGPPPAPFDDDRAAWQALMDDPARPSTVITTLDGTSDNFLQQAMAFPAIFHATGDDPLSAVVEAVWTAASTMGRGRQDVLFADLRAAFPTLG